MTRHAQKTENLTETVRKVSQQKGTEIHHGQWHGNSYRGAPQRFHKVGENDNDEQKEKKKTNT